MKQHINGLTIIPAWIVKDRLLSKMNAVMGNDRYFFLPDNPTQAGRYPEVPDKDDTGSEMHAILQDDGADGKIVGFVRASLNWYSRRAYCNGFVSLSTDVHIGPVIEEFIDDLVRRFHVVAWDVVVGNPIESFYDRICSKHNGYSYIRRDYALLSDGRFYDERVFHIVSK